MGELLERIKLNNLVYGKDIFDNFKNNSLYFYEKYQKSDDLVTSVPFGSITFGGFYFFHYKDESNWMKYAPVFTVEFKKFNNLIVIIALNLNFIPLEVRSLIFDKFIDINDFEKDRDLKVNYVGIYDELKKYGYEWALMEFNLSQMVSVHRINMQVVPRFLYAQHPINKYDPKKLYEIWHAKLSKRKERDIEVSKVVLDEFYDLSKDISSNFDQLKGRIQRIQRNLEKYGGS
jgi:hypothetical protein